MRTFRMILNLPSGFEEKQRRRCIIGNIFYILCRTKQNHSIALNTSEGTYWQRQNTHDGAALVQVHTEGVDERLPKKRH